MLIYIFWKFIFFPAKIEVPWIAFLYIDLFSVLRLFLRDEEIFESGREVLLQLCTFPIKDSIMVKVCVTNQQQHSRAARVSTCAGILVLHNPHSCHHNQLPITLKKISIIGPDTSYYLPYSVVCTKQCHISYIVMALFYNSFHILI